jgi:membrane protease YdiL (CAAX protease family)
LKRELRNALIAIIVFAISIVLISFVDSLIAIYYAGIMGLDLEAASVAAMKYLLVANEVILASLAIIFFTKVFKRRLVELGLIRINLSRNAALGLIIGAGGWFASVAVTFLLCSIVPFEVPEWFTKMVTATSSVDLYHLLILTWVLVGPCEELFFRGFVQEVFAAWKGPVAGVIAGSILFGLAHFNPLLWFRTIPTAFLGLIYGIVYAKRKSLLPVAVAHSLNDTIGFALAFFVL